MPETPTLADRLRACADWLDQHPEWRDIDGSTGASIDLFPHPGPDRTTMRRFADDLRDGGAHPSESAFSADGIVVKGSIAAVQITLFTNVSALGGRPAPEYEPILQAAA